MKDTTFHLKLGYSCNNSCKHCVIKPKQNHLRITNNKQDLSLEEITKELHVFAKDKSSFSLVISGGEPTIRSDFLNILELSKLSKIKRVCIQTNGRKFSSMGFSRKIKQIIRNFDKEVYCVIPIHHSQSKIHDTITTKKDSFQETTSGISNLIRNGIVVKGKIIISTFNYQDLVNILMLFQNLDIYEVNIAFPHIIESTFSSYSAIVPRYQEIAKYILKVINTYKKSMKLTFETIPYCFYSKHPELNTDLLQLKGSAKVKALEQSLVDWNEEKKQIKTKGEQCSCCVYNDICEGVWTEYIIYHGAEEFIPVKKIHNINKLLKNIL